MRSLTAAAAVTMSIAVLAAGCNAASSDGGTAAPSGTPAPSPPSTATGPFTLPATACDLTTSSAVAQVSGRDSVRLTHAGVAPTGSTSKALTCAFTDGLVPVGILTVDEHPAAPGHTAAQELDDSVAGSLYRSASTQDLAGLGDAARYGRAGTIDGLTYASVWTVVVRGGQVGDLSVTIASHDPDASRTGLITIARSALASLNTGTAPTAQPSPPSTRPSS